IPISPAYEVKVRSINQMNSMGAGGVLRNRTVMEAIAGEVAQIAVDSRALPEEEFERKLRDCCRLAYRVAFAVLHQREEAEDVAQDTCLRAHREFCHMRNPERLDAWVVRVAWRLAIDNQRSSRRRERRERSEQWTVSADPGLTAEDLAASSEFERALHSALDELPEKLRTVVVLAAIQGYDMAEVARLLELPGGTVKSRLHTARKKLVEKMKRFAK
ncbi:MAG TPA: RNA polymerase sigma factor, partial [Terriglobia bacterium]|nr:RNA polymerase sigma factor [Terriglobia bacterium]